MITLRLSQLLALALAMLTVVIMASASGPAPREFVGAIYATFVLFAALLFGLLFLIMKWATGGSTTYWSPRPAQLRRVIVMIGAALLLHLALSWPLELSGLTERTAVPVALFCWTIAPAAFLLLGPVRWPTRLNRASASRVLLVGAPAIALALVVSWSKFALYPTGFHSPSAGALILSVAFLVLAASAEEIVFRVLLLTALLDATRSRLNAVFLSSATFGLTHAPLALLQPIAQQDWALLQLAASNYGPVLLMQTLAGLLLGAVWLRTGSIGLVVITHVIMNIGPVLPTAY